ncbi:MAG: hypothetical protein AB7N65_23010 [Vicinamibacterales bacterium]
MTRTVERLRLRAESAASLRRFLPRLEDAFRTAALPDAARRLIVVKRWDLGRLPSDVSPQTLSLMLESRFAAAGWTVAHGAEAGADAAHAVWFRDALDAHEIAARRLVAGLSCDAWFWPLALPSISEARSPAEQLRAIAFSVASLPEAPTALPHWVNSTVAAGGSSPLLEALRPGDGNALLWAARSPLSAADGSSVGSVSKRATRAQRDGKGSSVPGDDGADTLRVGSFDDRLLMIERLCAAAGGPHGLALARRHQAAVREDALPNALGRAAGIAGDSANQRVDVEGTFSALAHQSAGRPTAQLVGARTAPALFVSPPGVNPSAVSIALPLSSASELPPVHHQRQASAASPDALPSGQGPVARARAEAPAWTEPDIATTQAGGLLFLVPVLERLGFEEWCRDAGMCDVDVTAALVGRIFAQLLWRLGVGDDDPVWEFVRSLESEAVADMTTLDDHTARWLRTCRITLRRRARLGLATLVCRQAGLAYTATHVDLFFAADVVDMRIRRSGLDSDPGWVPWLGRVVTFHYGRRTWP